MGDWEIMNIEPTTFLRVVALKDLNSKDNITADFNLEWTEQYRIDFDKVHNLIGM